MSGFLGVLDAPASVPHLQALVDRSSDVPASDVPAPDVPADQDQLSLWLSSRVEGLSAQVGRQHEALLEISQVTGRINGAVERLNLRVQAFVRDMSAAAKWRGCQPTVYERR
jgi:hypothetical protein